MQTIEYRSLADHAQKLTADEAGRNRRLYRLIDRFAADEASAALRGAAAQAREAVLASAFSSAAVLLGDATDDAAHDRLRDSVASAGVLALVPAWIADLRELASSRPDTGACTIASALDLWSWTMSHFAHNDACVDELSAAVAPLLGARALAVDVAALNVPSDVAELRAALSHVQAAHASAAVAATCAELVFGYRRHLRWDAAGCAACFAGDDLDDLEAIIPGIAGGARAYADVIEADGSHAAKAGPCVKFDGVEEFERLRGKLDGCLTGARLAKDRAAAIFVASMDGRA